MPIALMGLSAEKGSTLGAITTPSVAVAKKYSNFTRLPVSLVPGEHRQHSKHAYQGGQMRLRAARRCHATPEAALQDGAAPAALVSTLQAAP